jgi:hypothetical protein
MISTAIDGVLELAGRYFQVHLARLSNCIEGFGHNGVRPGRTDDHFGSVQEAHSNIWISSFAQKQAVYSKSAR